VDEAVEVVNQRGEVVLAMTKIYLVNLSKSQEWAKGNQE
jgi:hypothetical protein